MKKLFNIKVQLDFSKAAQLSSFESPRMLGDAAEEGFMIDRVKNTMLFSSISIRLGVMGGGGGGGGGKG